MAETDKIIIPKGTYGIRLTFHVLNIDGTNYDLSGLTVTFKVWTSGTPGSLLVDATCTISAATSGLCYYEPESGDFDTVADYVWELEMTKAGFVDNTISGELQVTESG